MSAKKVEELNLDEWADMLDEYKKRPGYRSGAAMRIEDTPFTSTRYFGGMTYNGARYVYFEPKVPGEKPKEDGSPFVAWLMVREDFLKYVKGQLAKRKEGKKEEEGTLSEMMKG